MLVGRGASPLGNGGAQRSVAKPVDEKEAARILGLAVDLRITDIGTALAFLHFPDIAIPFEESVGAIEELRLEGKVRAICLSNVTCKQLHMAHTVDAIDADLEKAA